MSANNIEEFIEKECSSTTYAIADYESGVPRWCKGCGDHGVLTSVQKVLKDKQIPPETVVCVSGIGCSSRFPHYINTYGFHSIHGRALPISTGVALSRPDLHVLTVMGDGDCFSIGAGHWLHAIRYNVDLTVIVLDNEIYALTKKQASPTTQMGVFTNTSPKGAYLKGLNPLSVMMGMTNISFLAQTATWLPQHQDDTIRRAWDHKGLSFIRILQRCPVYMPKAFGDGGSNFDGVFLEHKDGIPVNKGILRNAPTIQHDFHDIHSAQKLALNDHPAPLGLLYQNTDLPTYQEIRYKPVKKLDTAGLVNKLNAEFDKYSMQSSSDDTSN